MAKLLWTQKQNIGPKPRVEHAMAYDAARERVVFSGRGDALGSVFFQAFSGVPGAASVQTTSKPPEMAPV